MQVPKSFQLSWGKSGSQATLLDYFVALIVMEVACDGDIVTVVVLACMQRCYDWHGVCMQRCYDWHGVPMLYKQTKSTTGCGSVYFEQYQTHKQHHMAVRMQTQGAHFNSCC
jgi:hypothetical protein